MEICGSLVPGTLYLAMAKPDLNESEEKVCVLGLNVSIDLNYLMQALL